MAKSRDIDFKKISKDADYCFNTIKDIETDGPDFEKILGQLEQDCEPAVAERLLHFDGYLKSKLEKSLKERLVDIVVKQNLPYKTMITNLIIQHKFDTHSKLTYHLIDKLLTKNPDFRDSFIHDETYRPLFRENFIDKIAANTRANIDWEKIKLTPLKKEVKDEAIEAVYDFTKPYSKEQESIIAIAKLLSDKDKVFAQLAKAEKMLAKLKQERKDSSEPVLDAKGKIRHQDHKLLSNFFYDWAAENGYKGASKLLRNVPAPEMLDIFAWGLLFKDKGVRGGHHGEFLHFWQWYILTEANKDNHILSVEPAELLKWIGKQHDGDVVWDRTFEGFGDSTCDAIRNSLYRPEFDARIFTVLNKYLLSDECKANFPTISELMKSRLSKVSVQKYSTPTQEKVVLFKKPGVK